MIKLEKDIQPELRITDLLRYQGVCGYYFKVRDNKRFAPYILDVKENAYSFSEVANINYAKVHFSNKTLSESIGLLKFPCVLKPTHEASGKGVIICYSETNMLYLNSRREIKTLTDLEVFCNDLLSRKVVRRDSWMCEELILSSDSEIARDIKFYIFYGKIGLILESQRIPEVKRSWRNEKFEHVKTGKYDDILFVAEDLPQELITLAQDISLKLPIPFIRIDFLVANGKYYLGELTPAPERYWTFNDEWDLTLGKYYQNACMRLINDIGYGKKFEEYNYFINNCKIS